MGFIKTKIKPVVPRILIEVKTDHGIYSLDSRFHLPPVLSDWPGRYFKPWDKIGDLFFAEIIALWACSPKRTDPELRVAWLFLHNKSELIPTLFSRPSPRARFVNLHIWILRSDFERIPHNPTKAQWVRATILKGLNG
jgi:hypothetical protein